VADIFRFGLPGLTEGLCKMIKDLVKKNRSYRRFYQSRVVDPETLKDLVDLARLSGSAANLQPLRYILACDPQINEQIFSCLAWAGYLKDWPGPKEGERPAAYIVIVSDTAAANDYVGYDCGIASQSILLGAGEKGLAGCMLGAIKRRKLREILKIDNKFKILLVIAIGEPKEKVVIETVGSDDNIRYWRDDEDVHHVPKRRLQDIIIDTY